ncbi:MAG: heavy metal-associated domain-containing protein [Crocinitomicaceae bacterium]|nr:heavy metal-associated domain-containing protein [Crocinitomicaceae bacterium]
MINKTSFLSLVFLFITFFSFSQKKEAKTQKVVIKTSTQCGMCKEKIEEELNYSKGIIYSELDVPTQMLTVKFKPAKISLQALKQKIAKIGYDADEVKAKEEDIQKLPKCCQPGAHFKLD